MGKLIRIAKLGVLSLAGLMVLALFGLSLPLGGRKTLSVQTGSMAPAIRPGSLVRVTHVPDSQLAVGDVITFTNPQNSKQTVTHRIVQILGQKNGPKQFVTKGDANQASDIPVSQHRVVGKVQGVIPYAGFGVDFLRTWPGLIMLVYIPALAVTVQELRRLTAYYKSRQPYVLPELQARRQRSKTHPARNVAAGSALLLVIAVAIPVQAALVSTATMTGNTLSVAGMALPQAGSVQLRRVFVSCAPEDTGVATMLSVILYNGGKQNVDISSWRLQTGDTVLFTFPAGTSVSARSLLDIETDIAPGLTYGVGTLALHHGGGQVIDETTWNHIAADRACQVTN